MNLSMAPGTRAVITTTSTIIVHDNITQAARVGTQAANCKAPERTSPNSCRYLFITNVILFELFRKSSREGHKLTADGMNERQGTGVESKTTYRRRLRSILPVTCYRTTQLS